MNILYHITPAENLKSIHKHGLIPAFQKGLSCVTKLLDGKAVIWLTDNPNYILTAQAGSEWVNKYNPVVLKVNCDGLNVKRYMSYIRNPPIHVWHEYYVEHTIKQHFGVEE